MNEPYESITIYLVGWGLFGSAILVAWNLCDCTLGQAPGLVGMTLLLMVPYSLFIWYPAAKLLGGMRSIHPNAPAIAGLLIALGAAGFTAWNTVLHTAPADLDCHAQYDKQGGHVECD